jgi:hypothetical protein
MLKRPTKKACSPACAQENQALFNRWSFTPRAAYPFGVMKINSNCCARRNGSSSFLNLALPSLTNKKSLLSCLCTGESGFI